jgi:hypothetical protein
VVDGEVIGGIGASFATPEDDEQVARADLPRSASNWNREPASVPERSHRIHCTQCGAYVEGLGSTAAVWPAAMEFGPALELQLPRPFSYTTADGRGRT